MTPTSLFEMLKNSQKDFDPELVDTYKRLDSGWEPTIELLEEGRRQGLYRQDADFTIFKIMMDASVARFFETDTLRKAKISYVDALNQVVDILLTGIKA